MSSIQKHFWLSNPRDGCRRSRAPARGWPIRYIERPGASSGEPLFLHHDQQGSTRLLTNKTGETETAYTYTPYGKLEASTGTATTPLRYDGQYTTSNTNLIYLRARTYDPNFAEFLTPDPALQATGEPYAYTKDNPENHQDSSGRCGDNAQECAELKAGIAEAEDKSRELNKQAGDKDSEAQDARKRAFEAYLQNPILAIVELQAAWSLESEAGMLRKQAQGWDADAAKKGAAMNALGCPAAA